MLKLQLCGQLGESKRKLVKRQNFLADFSLQEQIYKERIHRNYSRFIERFHCEATVTPNNFKIRSILSSHATETLAEKSSHTAVPFCLILSHRHALMKSTSDE